MTQDEAIAAKRVASIKDTLDKIDKDIKVIENCIKIGKRLGLVETDLIPWGKKENELKETKNKLHGELHNIYNTCEHDFTCVGSVQTIFGEENIYQCKKCGYKTVNE